AIAALKAGALDAVFVSSTDPDYDFEEISENEDIVSVPIDYTVLGDTEETPYYGQTLMPANTYQGMDDSVAAMATMWILVCNADMDEEMVYQLTQALWDNAAAIQNDSKINYDLLFENAMDGMAIPLHPGAQKYYDEMVKNEQ
ncbi:MAG: TAXI family TRAP transporter solute-binding subunit, partial [Eubacteriales bacterium]